MMPSQAATVRQYDGQALGRALEQEIRQMYWQMQEARRAVKNKFASTVAVQAKAEKLAAIDKAILQGLLYLRRVGLGRWP